MSVTYGFYNSVNHDRLYDALEFSRLFDGIVKDGVFKEVGARFAISPVANSMSVNVAPGRAWFDRTWTFNDDNFLVELSRASLEYNRIDVIVLEVDTSEDVRANCIKAIQGIPGTTPEKPEIKKGATLHQYPLAYITIPRGSTSISESNIENMVGTDECPYAAAALTGELEQQIADIKGNINDLTFYVDENDILHVKYYKEVEE